MLPGFLGGHPLLLYTIPFISFFLKSPVLAAAPDSLSAFSSASSIPFFSYFSIYLYLLTYLLTTCYLRNPLYTLYVFSLFLNTLLPCKHSYNIISSTYHFIYHAIPYYITPYSAFLFFFTIFLHVFFMF